MKTMAILKLQINIMMFANIMDFTEIKLKELNWSHLIMHSTGRSCMHDRPIKSCLAGMLVHYNLKTHRLACLPNGLRVLLFNLFNNFSNNSL